MHQAAEVMLAGEGNHEAEVMPLTCRCSVFFPHAKW